MKPDPQVLELLAELAKAKVPGYEVLGVQQARALYSARADMNMPRVEVAQVVDMHIEGPGGRLPLRIYRAYGSQDTEQLPALVYFHGGGWVLGDLDTHDPICRELANMAHCAVVSVGYRLSPEHKFPEPVEDAIAATRWVAENAASLHIDSQRIAVGGDSAGGTMAAVVCLEFRDQGGPKIVMQALMYPPTDLLAQTASHMEFARGYGLTRESVLWMRGHYIRDEQDPHDWRCSPLRASDHRNLPPAFILTAGFDTLRDEGRLYAEALHNAGVLTTYECFEGMVHGFINLGRVLAGARHALYRVAQALKAVFEPPQVRVR
ncbi:MAG TPA: alpha/beta hydrolase [Burkholderiales bacterium]|nr:alpha/beta hydrolase [Burkholderiales bacterium]